MSYISRNPKRTIAALATVLAASGVAVGSGATFSSQSTNPASIARAGTLVQTNSRNEAAVVAPANMKPGDEAQGSVVIRNAGSLPARMTLDLSNRVDTFAPGNMTITISQNGVATPLYQGDVSGLATSYNLGTWTAGEERTYTVRFALALAADNTQQNRSAGSDLTFNGAQE